MESFNELSSELKSTSLYILRWELDLQLIPPGDQSIRRVKAKVDDPNGSQADAVDVREDHWCRFDEDTN